jgi:hypothetical protein
MTSFVPQQLVADQALINNIDGNRAAQRFDHFLADRNQMAAMPQPPQLYGPLGGGGIGPGPGGGGTLGTQLPFEQIRVGRDNGQAEKLNQMMEAIQQDRSRLLNTANVPHHYQQQRMGGWNPIETVKVERPGLGNQVQQQLDALQQQRNQIQVPMRQF